MKKGDHYENFTSAQEHSSTTSTHSGGHGGKAQGFPLRHCPLGKWKRDPWYWKSHRYQSGVWYQFGHAHQGGWALGEKGHRR